MTAKTIPAMVRMYFEDARFGDGYRLAMVLEADEAAVTLYLPCELAVVRVEAARLAKATSVTYRPGVVRANMLRRAKLYRQIGRRFSRQAAVRALLALGTKQGVIAASVEAAPLPETVAAREARALRAERMVEWAAAEAAIRARNEWQLAQPAEPVPVAKKGRAPRRREAATGRGSRSRRASRVGSAAAGREPRRRRWRSEQRKAKRRSSCT